MQIRLIFKGLVTYAIHIVCLPLKCIFNSVHVTTDNQILIRIHKKADLWKMKDNAMNEERNVWTIICFDQERMNIIYPIV